MRGKRTPWFVGLMVLAVLAAACVPEGVRLPQSPLLGALERKSGLIAYVGLDGNIHTIDQAGGRKTAITDDADLASEDGSVRFYDFPTWEPSGERLAYQGFSLTGEGRQSVGLYTSHQEGGEATEIYNSRDMLPIYIYWSPDGELVSFLTASVGGGPLALQVVPSSGGDVEVIDTGSPYYWVWSPNTQQLLAHVGGAARLNPGGARLSLLTLGPNVSEIGLGLEPSSFRAPVFSPDGSHSLLAVEGGAGREELVLADSDGNVLSPLAPIQGAVAFDWAPAGDFVAYVESDSPGEGVLGSLRFLDLADIRNPIPVDTESDGVAAFFWSPQGDKVAFFEPRVLQGTADPESEGETGTETRELVLTVSIAEARSGETRELVTFRPTQQFLNILPFFDQYQRSATIWSPDGSNIVLPAMRADGTPGIFIVPVSGQLGERFIEDGTLAFWSWQ